MNNQVAMKNKYPSIDQAKLKVLCDDLCDNLEALLDTFGLDYKNNAKMISMNCPIHGGDNPSALNIYPEGDSYRGNWKCRTHNCEQEFKSSVIGFVRGIISRQKYGWSEPGDKSCSFKEALDYVQAFLNKDLNSIKISKTEKEKKNFTNIVNYINAKVEKSESRITRKQIIKAIEIPAQYYISRNYSQDILVKYDVGLCNNSSKPMKNRIVVPVYDIDYKYMVGCTGRSIFEKCDNCSSYHDPSSSCLSDENKWLCPKWKHSPDFKSQNYLYNFWFAKKHIYETGIAIIVESPGNVWRLEENTIHNSVAIFGSSLSDRQKILLDSSGAMTLILLTDNDEAGKKAAQQIKNKCQNTYRIFMPQISKNDVAEMTPQEINDEIKEYIKRII
jgi:5S rRNA maturation endonuclease (ribonuclease M5)